MQMQTAMEWYISRSPSAAYGFVSEIETGFKYISSSKLTHRKTQKNYHEYILKKYPFVLIYRFDEDKKQQVIVSIFNTRQNPRKKNRYLRKSP
jgi:plasmid stabilization system protein ParE